MLRPPCSHGLMASAWCLVDRWWCCGGSGSLRAWIVDRGRWTVDRDSVSMVLVSGKSLSGGFLVAEQDCVGLGIRGFWIGDFFSAVSTKQ
uniref:Uncharacterized protein n=1 Tax=Fagus sylvatica TaxID=28930 RepID=A0A2N9IIW5_FAGSY